jgi:hypothetical protein
MKQAARKREGNGLFYGLIAVNGNLPQVGNSLQKNCMSQGIQTCDILLSIALKNWLMDVFVRP